MDRARRESLQGKIASTIPPVTFAIARGHPWVGRIVIIAVISPLLVGIIIRTCGIREVFTMTIDPTGNAFSYEVPRETDYQDLCEEAEWKLAALLPPLEPDRLRTLVVVGKVAEEIVRVANDERASLIIMGILGKKGWRRMHLDSVSEKVVQRSPVPVMTLWVPRSATSDRGRARDLVFTG